MRDYLVLFPKLVPLGGAEATTAWMLQFLSERGKVAFLTWEYPNLPEVDRIFGTHLQELDIDIILIDSPMAKLLSLLSLSPQLLKLRLFVLAARRQRSSHRVIISAFNDLDLKERAIQYLHGAPVNNRNHGIQCQQSLVSRLTARLYTSFCDLLVPWQDRRIARNFTIANSAWTSREFSSVYGRQVDAIVFPPPLGRPENRSNLNKLNRFIAIARVHEDKGLLDVIEIVSSLRELEHDIGLSMFLVPYSLPLMRQLEDLAAENSHWLSLHVNASREAVDQAICEHKYGIHGSPQESYGMAVAEMLLGHCLTAVYEQGGQIEIVTEPELRFHSRADAVTKLDRILRDPALESSLRESQRQRSQHYSRDEFSRCFRKCIDQFEEVEKIRG